MFDNECDTLDKVMKLHVDNKNDLKVSINITRELRSRRAQFIYYSSSKVVCQYHVIVYPTLT